LVLSKKCLSGKFQRGTRIGIQRGNPEWRSIVPLSNVRRSLLLSFTTFAVWKREGRMPTGLPLTPHHDHRSLGVRRIYIQNLTDLLHVCLLRGEVERARRAWGILVSPVRFRGFQRHESILDLSSSARSDAVRSIGELDGTGASSCSRLRNQVINHSQGMLRVGMLSGGSRAFVYPLGKPT